MTVVDNLDNSFVLYISDPSGAGEARRQATILSRHIGFDETDLSKAAIIVTEAATNLVKHAHGGEIAVRALEAGDCRGIEVVALDQGPGIPDVARARSDGFSSGGTPGTGLGAIERLASYFDLYSQPGRGTALLAEYWSGGEAPAPRPSLDIGGISTSKPGEQVSGDAWAYRMRNQGIRVLVVDGLGHGAGAADAAREAVLAFREAREAPPPETLGSIHDALKKTRGAAAALADLDLSTGVVRYAGVGNISAVILSEAGRRSLVSHNGTMGHEVRKIQEFTYPWPQDGILILHSDGAGTHWDAGAYPGLLNRRPSLIAGVLYRDFSRRRDDVTVLAIKQ